jgi:hypothetical protein
MNQTMLGELDAAQGRVQINQAARAFPGSANLPIGCFVPTREATDLGPPKPRGGGTQLMLNILPSYLTKHIN